VGPTCGDHASAAAGGGRGRGRCGLRAAALRLGRCWAAEGRGEGAAAGLGREAGLERALAPLFFFFLTDFS